jgi:hypothetical protein
VHPACHHATAGTQLDHTVSYARAEDGATTAENLGSGCQRMHNAKTHDGWRLTQPSPGTFVRTSPTGRTDTRRAQPLVPGWTPAPHGDPPRKDGEPP